MKYISTFFTVVLLITLISTLTAQTNWTKYSGNPVLNPGALGSWEDYMVYAPFVLKHGDTLKMWYTGSRSFDVDEIGYATSTDGINWQKHPQNPVLRVGASGSWDDEVVSHSQIIVVDTTYHMWYGGTGVQPYYSYRIGYATSSDGINWTKHPDPVMGLGDPGEWDSATLAGASYFFDGDTFHMWYGGCDGPNWDNASIGYAKSPDGITWEKYQGNPVFSGSSGNWDSLAVYAPYVIVDSFGYKMWYAGWGGGPHDRIGYATSLDGIDWVALDTCVLDVGNPGTWDDEWIGHPHVLLDDTTYFMWYIGSDYGTPNYGDRIGYATQYPLKIDDVIFTNVPFDYVLLQNYPNPFNPSTTIAFDLPKTSEVTLKVYNILGEEVAMLVSDRLSAGSYSYEWDASNLASGVYLYRLQAGDYVETRKMVLMR